MTNQEQLDILKQGVEIWNEWRRKNLDESLQLSEIDLEGSNLSGINLRGADLSRANLNNTNLSEADLSNARLWKAHLEKANLSHIYLRDAYLYKAWLKQANFQSANCEGATFARAYLHQAVLHKADLSVTNFNGADLSEADLRSANLTSASFVSTNLTRANLTGCSIFGISAWRVHLQDTVQSHLIIDDGKTTITVDNFEIAQFIYLLLEHRKLRGVINSVIDKGVLLLGRFDYNGLELLYAIADKLREINYLPIIFDFARPKSRDLTETIMILAGLSRFVIADLSGPSVPQELYATIPHFKIPFAPLLEEKERSHSLFRDFLGYPWVLPLVEFRSKKHLIELLIPSVIQPAEEKFQERQASLDAVFNC
ncbi:pentapeptide repeat-containing protein [Reticulibacter mediterranei]|nr:pentapeptide repeat-containing protein [Reticulibacter mediterranei]